MPSACQKWELERSKARHRKKIRTVRPTSQSNARGQLDFTAPNKFSNLLSRSGKRAYLDDTERARIDFENALLLSKIEGPSPSSRRRAKPHEFAPGVRIDANQYPMIDCYLSRQPSPWAPGGGMSHELINKSAKLERIRTTIAENDAMARRLLQSRSTYSIQKFEDDYRASSVMRDRISDYPARVPATPSRSRAATAEPRSSCGSRGRLFGGGSARLYAEGEVEDVGTPNAAAPGACRDVTTGVLPLGQLRPASPPIHFERPPTRDSTPAGTGGIGPFESAQSNGPYRFPADPY